MDDPFASPASESYVPPPRLAPPDFQERELSASEVLALTGQLLSANPGQFIAIAALVGLPASFVTEGAPYLWPALEGSLSEVALSLAVGMWETLATLAIARCTEAMLLGHPSTAGAELQAGLARLPASIVANFLTMLIILPLFLLLILPGLIAGGRLLLVTYVIAARGSGPLAALARSNELTQRRTGKAVAYFMLIMVWSGVVGALGGAASLLTLTPELSTLAHVAASLIGSMLGVPVTVLLGVVFLNWDRMADFFAEERAR